MEPIFWCGWADLGVPEYHMTINNDYLGTDDKLGFPYQGNRVFLHDTLQPATVNGAHHRGWEGNIV